MGRFGPGHRRPYDVAEVVRGFDADVVVVLEAWRAHGQPSVLDSLTADGYRVEPIEFNTFTVSGFRPRHEVPGEGHWGLAVCSRLPILARRELPIGRVHRDPAGHRAALLCTIDVHGVEVDVVAVHVSSRIWQLAPLQHLRALRPQLPPRGRVAVIAGDFNLWGPAVARALPGWHRAVLGRTYPAHRPHSQIDHVLVRDDVTVLSAEVLELTPSDHRPVRVRLRVPRGADRSEPGEVGKVD